MKIYYEGDAKLRPGFKALFRPLCEAARLSGGGLEFLPASGTPWRVFRIALQQRTQALPILLVDSEAVEFDKDRVLQENGIDKSQSTRVFWMIPCMESWLVAQPEVLDGYYGKGFLRRAIPARSDVEGIDKQQIRNSLKAATVKTQKGPYHKTNHAPEILAKLDSTALRDQAPEFNRLWKELEELFAVTPKESQGN